MARGAPCLDAFLGIRATIIPRLEWEQARTAASSCGPTLLSLEQLPFGRDRAICAPVERQGPTNYHVRLYREDPNDPPEGQYNVYDFLVYDGGDSR